MKKTTFLLILLSAAALLFTSSCASVADKVRPGDISVSAAAGEAFQCTEEKLRGDLTPFSVDWSDGQRTALESAMKRGVAVVKMTCEGPEIMKACMLLGDYAYNGVSKKTKLIEMKDSGSAAVNFGGMIFSPSIQTAMSQGRTLNLAYVLVGAESTTVIHAVPSQLKGRCEGATHFVFGAQLGAFALETSAHGESKLAVEMLGGQGGAQTDSSKSTRSTDGQAERCENASEKDDEKTDGCSALMRVELMAIAPKGTPPQIVEETAPARRATDCPDGYAWNGDICQVSTEVAFGSCDPSDSKAECLEQCEKGSLESCNNAAFKMLTDFNAIRRQDIGAFRDDLPAWLKDYEGVGTHFVEACAQDLPSACGVVGVTAWHTLDDIFSPEELLVEISKGCILGEPLVCSIYYYEAEVRPRAEKLAVLGQACDHGVALACGLWVEEAMFNVFEGSLLDPNVATYAARACYGGSDAYCGVAAGFHEQESDCLQTFQKITLDGEGDLIQKWASSLFKTRRCVSTSRSTTTRAPSSSPTSTTDAPYEGTRSRSSCASYDPGSGELKRIHCPVPGWVNPSVAACSNSRGESISGAPRR